MRLEHLTKLSLAPRIVNHVLRSRWLRAARPPANGEVQMSASAQMKEARRELERQGFTATKTRGGHWRFEHPDMHGPVFAPDTPSDYRAIKNLYAMLRRKTQRPEAA
jgi:predicted RNA binding protein YcfA (HicA-like mRNA interferase family)